MIGLGSIDLTHLTPVDEGGHHLGRQRLQLTHQHVRLERVQEHPATDRQDRQTKQTDRRTPRTRPKQKKSGHRWVDRLGRGGGGLLGNYTTTFLVACCCWLLAVATHMYRCCSSSSCPGWNCCRRRPGCSKRKTRAHATIGFIYYARTPSKPHTQKYRAKRKPHAAKPKPSQANGNDQNQTQNSHSFSPDIHTQIARNTHPCCPRARNAWKICPNSMSSLPVTAQNSAHTPASI